MIKLISMLVGIPLGILGGVTIIYIASWIFKFEVTELSIYLGIVGGVVAGTVASFSVKD